MRYFKQRDLMTCAPVAIFNAARHYRPSLSWSFFKRIERKCKTGRLYRSSRLDRELFCPGTAYENEIICAKWLSDLGFFEIVDQDVQSALDDFKKSSDSLCRIVDHIKGENNGTALIRGQFKIPTRGKKFRKGRPKELVIIRSEAPMHCVFVPRVFTDRMMCVGLGDAGLMRIPFEKIKVNGFWLLKHD